MNKIKIVFCAMTNKKIKSNLDLDFDAMCIEGVRARDEHAFKQMFLNYYPSLCSVAADYIGSFDIGKEVAQEVFVSIWERGHDWRPDGPLRPYLYQAVCKKSMTYIRQDQSRKNAINRYKDTQANDSVQIDELVNDEAVQEIWRAVKKLPRQRYMIFILHKRHGFTYKEIASIMDITSKTVENQMGRALKFLRDELA